MNDEVMNDEETKKKAIECDNNTLVIARAGSGKTTFLINKLLFILENKKISNIKKIALITFTNEAVNNLNKKISMQNKKIYNDKYVIKTIDSFIMSEIIFPFFYSYKGYLKNTFNFRRKFSEKKRNKSELIELMEKNIIGSYENNKQNFLCELALDILKSNRIAREYMLYTYEWIFIDEAQDCDEDMFKLFTYLSDELNIKLCIVGDDKQSIFEWRGGSGDRMLSLKNGNFKTFYFKYNYRSKPSINLLSNLISKDLNVSNIEELYNRKNQIYDTDIFYYKNNNQFEEIEIIKNLENSKIIDFSNDNIFFLFCENNNLNRTMEKLKQEYPKDIFIKKINLDIPLFEEISRYYFFNDYDYNDFILKTEINTGEVSNKEIKEYLTEIKKNINQENVCQYLDELYTILNVEYEKDELTNFICFLRDEENQFIFKNGNYKTLLTIHSVKGLENDVVILFLKFSRRKNQKEFLNMLYVGVTRAKKRLIIIDDVDFNLIDDVDIDKSQWEKQQEILETCKLIEKININ